MAVTTPPEDPSANRPPRAAAVPTEEDHLPGSRRLTARQAILMVLAAFAILVVADGDGMRSQAERLDKGTEKTIVLAVAKPAGWIADHLPFAAVVDEATGWLSPDDDLGSDNGDFTVAGGGGASRVSPAAFDSGALGLKAGAKPKLRSLLVTGDSMSQPMDAELARAFAPIGVKTTRDPKFGTAISKTNLLDWGRYSKLQARRDAADATVILLGAAEGFPMKTPTGTVSCCGVRWAAEYATRVRAMMETYGRGGRARVYWLLIPQSSDDGRNAMLRVVNTSIRVAAGAYGQQVRVVDLPSILTPGGRYRSAMDVDGRKQIVRDPDGTHLNEVGGRLAADLVRGALGRDFDLTK